MTWQPTALTPITVGATKAAIGLAVWAAAGDFVSDAAGLADTGAAELETVDGVGAGAEGLGDAGAEGDGGGGGGASASALAVGDVVAVTRGVVGVAVNEGVGLADGALDSSGRAD